MPKLDVTFTLSQKVVEMADLAPRNLVLKIMPNAISRAVPIVREAIIGHLPDGDEPTDASPNGSRAKQSAKSKARFPYKMNKRVRVKSISDSTGVLKIVGVDSKASHVNFDHGDKAKSAGRVHKLWWIKGVREKYATPKMRKQHKDIPKLVEAEVGGYVVSVVEASIRRSIAAGELL